MDSFIEPSTFATLAGCVAVSAAITQIVKPYFPKVSTKVINLVAASIATAVAFYFNKDFSADGIILGVLNIIPIMLGSTGAYEYIVKPVVTKEKV